MIKNSLLLYTAVLAATLISVPVSAAPYPTIAQDVGVCDPNAPSHCAAPNSDGSINVKMTTGGAASTYVSTAALASNLVVKNTSANLLSFNASADSTLSAAAWWFMIFNSTTAPADGAVTPIKCYAAPSGTTSISGAFVSPPLFTTGITFVVSTTGCFNKTASAHAFLSGDYQ